MARPSSNISSSLSKKRKKNLLRKLIFFGTIILILFFAFIFFIRSKSLQIQTITVTGNGAVSQSEILAAIAPSINKKYLWLIPTNNFFFLQKSEMQTLILKNIPEIQSVQISFTGPHTLLISVNTRKSVGLWCDGAPKALGNCYTLDANGFIFKSATSTLGTNTETFFGLISGNPIGQTYFPGHFADAQVFLNQLSGMNLNPISFSASSSIGIFNYEIGLFYGGNIIADSEKTFSEDVTDLQAVISDGYLKTDIKSLKKINYIDLRYQNKVILDVN